MKSSTSLSLSLVARRSNLPLAAVLVIGLSVVLGMYLTNTVEELLAYVLVTLACAVPIGLWIWGGALGIPVMPAICGMYFIYYALPIIRNQSALEGYGPSEILTGGATVALFLAAATVMWWPIVGSVRRVNDTTSSLVSGSWLNRIIFLGLGCGIFFHVSVFSNVLGSLGPLFGLLRSVMLSFAISACFMLGHARALGTLRGEKWVKAVACLGIMVLLAWFSFFLVGGMLYCLSAVLGYVITSKRMPWRFLSVAVIVIIILHAGKDEMRDKYWAKDTNFSATISLLDMPQIMGEWAEAGLTKVFVDQEYSSAIDRASLFSLLLRVEALVPDYIPFLNGASYALLPEMLVPRFLDPEKITSQAAMSLLNVSAGIQTAEDAQKTSIGWGILTEAYFNFGYIGVTGIGLLFGLFCGFIQRWTIGAQLFSLPCFIALSVLMQLITVELEVAGAVTAIFQSVVAVSLAYWFIKLLVKKKGLSQRPAEATY